MNTTLHLTLRVNNVTHTLLHLIDKPEEVARYEGRIRDALRNLTDRNSSQPKAGRPGKLVLITSVDYDTHDQWVNLRGAGSVRDLEKKEFASAAEASRYLGCASNEVAINLAAAKRRGRVEAKVRGVTFRQADGIGGSN